MSFASIVMQFAMAQAAPLRCFAYSCAGGTAEAEFSTQEE